MPGFPCKLIFLADEIVLWLCGDICGIIVMKVLEFNLEEIIGYEGAFGNLYTVWGDKYNLRHQ